MVLKGSPLHRFLFPMGTPWIILQTDLSVSDANYEKNNFTLISTATSTTASKMTTTALRLTNWHR